MLDAHSGVERIVAVVADDWDELPAHFGNSWADVFPQIAELAWTLDATGDSDRNAVLAMRLAMLFAGHPTVAPRLRHSAEGTRRHGTNDVAKPIPLATALGALRSRVAEVATTRYTEVFAPRSMRLGERGVITVRLTRTGLAASIGPDRVSVDGDREVELRLYDPSGAFTIEGNPIRALTIPPDTDSETAAFHLTALATSTTGLTLDLLQNDVIAATIHIPLPIVAEPAAVTEQSPVAGFEVAPTTLTPADLELRIIESKHDGGSTLSFFLHSPNGSAGYHHFPAGEVTISGSPRELQRKLFDDLESRHGSRGVRRQRALGYQLYRELLPPALRSAYRDLSAKPLRTLHITSDEPWIPWELVLPYDADGPGPTVEDDHWCVRFELTRWLAGPAGPPACVTARSAVFLEASDPPGADPLPAVRGERTQLLALTRRLGMADHSPARADSAAVDALLDKETGHIGLWHFAGHGDVSALLLADGVLLTPDELAGPRQSALRARRPLVFLNACRAARQEPSWSGLGGWAQAWAGRCWSPFVGPMWQVTDQPAAFLAAAFYNRLATGATVGRAMTEARLDTRQRWPDDPTWLAYSVYAHPNTTIPFRPDVP
ncbi:CHAT domain-containing protein [Streptomyces sp. SID3343]|uniref:CHAT domain-containing protein n=1 Tax=Streptomyces sp. SID3343 TaxID=2690260 RepID=UPI00136940EA|nr:CHAT domain-containing protein [Streptomyces sp. SID3343]MYV97250.1 CHAT domain-containing protein [Streptomyces sp. SID3343]